MEDCVQSTFLGNWVLVAPYLCSKFHIFNRPILEKYVSHFEEGGGGGGGALPLKTHTFSVKWPSSCS
jgi:hypothetical protein